MQEAQSSGKVFPHEFFSVSERVSFLEPLQIKALEEAFENWKTAAKGPAGKLARSRMQLIFLLLRHTGARLGEVLSLDDTVCFDEQGPSVRLGGEARERLVPIPEEVYSEIMTTLESDAGEQLRGDFFHADPGYFRRICYARGKECGLSKDKVCPKALRNTRAVEMLRSGIPIPVVRDALGHSSLDLTAVFQRFSSGDMQALVRTAHQTLRKQTSSRNSFVGHVTGVKDDGVMADVSMRTMSGIDLSAVITSDSLHNLNIVEGSPVIATVKAPLVNVVIGGGIASGSARNRLRAEILGVTESTVISEVVGRLPDGTDVCALISTRSLSDLGLKAGDEAEFRFKAMSVVLNTIQL